MKKNTCIIMVWLPWSWKSSRALEKSKEGHIIVWNDIEREIWPHANEREIKASVREKILKARADNKDVIIDNTHMNARTLRDTETFCKSIGYKVEIKDMKGDDAPHSYLATAISQNKSRDRVVPESVIHEMYLANYAPWVYEREWNTNKIYLVDIDWTLANGSHREHFVKGDKKDWKSYFNLLWKDKLIQPVAQVVRELFTNSTIIIISWRPDSYCQETLEWLDNNHIQYDHILMRHHRDKRPDTEVKKDLYNRCLSQHKDRIVGVFDDRPSVIKMRIEQWVFVFGCQQGYKEF